MTEYRRPAHQINTRHCIPVHGGATVAPKAKAPVLENTSRKAVATPTESGVLSRPEFMDASVLGCVSGFGLDGWSGNARRTSLRVFSTSSPPVLLENNARGFQSRKGAETMTTSPLASRRAAPNRTQPTPGNTSSLDPTAPTLDDFTDWVLALHGDTFDAMDATEGDAYRAHLASFGRTNTALQLLTQFRAAHAAKVSETGGAA